MAGGQNNGSDNFFLDILKALSGGFFMVFAPLALIGLGAVVGATGLSYEYEFVAWVGLALLGAGVLWGVLVFLFTTSSWF